ncbi:MAG TPA: PmoA family protein, partial [Bacteroidia bacterium]|nr:PmoA family protein [Bacteroidia bacterium]
SEIDWIGHEGLPFARETRTMRFSLAGPDVVVDFESTLASKVSDLRLDGDPQHAGFHFRAHNDVNDATQKATYFIRPGTGIGVPGTTVNWSPTNDTESTRDLPWKAMCFTLRDTQTTVVYLDHPGNPKPARSSERSYGRFGSYFATDVPADRPLRVRYRLVVHPGEYDSTAEIEKLSAAFVAGN